MIPDSYILPGALAILGVVVVYRLWQARPGFRQAVTQAVSTVAAPAASAPTLKAAFDAISRDAEEHAAAAVADEIRRRRAEKLTQELRESFAPPPPPAPPKDQPAPPA